MKLLHLITATLLCLLMPVNPGMAQQIAQNSEVLVVPGEGKFFRWYGQQGRTYFFQASDPNDHLRSWIWSDAIESGNDELISYEFGGSADKGFFRLHYTDAPPPNGVPLEQWDADADGLGNALELSLQGNPLKPDTSGDGIPDGWAHAFGHSLKASIANELFQGGPYTNLQAYQSGVPANPNATYDDHDGDGLANGMDADPKDPDVDWQKVAERSYALVEIHASENAGQVRDLNDMGLVLFDEGVWNAGSWHVLDDVEHGGDFHVDPYDFTFYTVSNEGWRLSPAGNVIEQGYFNISGTGDVEDARHVLRRAFDGQTSTYASWASTLQTLDWQNEGDFLSFNVLGEDATGRIFISKEIYPSMPGEMDPAIWILDGNLNKTGSYSIPAGYRAFFHGNQVTPQGWLGLNVLPHTGNSPAARTIVWNPNGQEVSVEGGIPWFFTGLSELPHGKPSLVCLFNSTPGGFVYLLNAAQTAFKKADQLSGKNIHTFAGDGTAMTSDGKIWINGDLVPIRDLCSAYGVLEDDGWAFQIHKANKQGAYLLEAHRDAVSRPMLLVPLEFKQRIPVIPDEDGESTYEYVSCPTLPWDQPFPGVEITKKEISGDQLVLSAKIYDVLSDVSEGMEAMTPHLWVNDREIPPVSGDKNGVYRLNNHAYKLYPGRNEVTVTVRNAVGVSASHSVTIEGDSAGYTVVDEPPCVPAFPTYPVVCEIKGLDLSEEQKATLDLAGKSVEIGQEQDAEEPPPTIFRTEPFVSLDIPETATAAQLAALPADKALFPADLEHDMEFAMLLPGATSPVQWVASQCGIELVIPERVTIKVSDEADQPFQIKARALGRSPDVHANLTFYQNDEARMDLSSIFQSAYQQSYEALPNNEKNNPVTFEVARIHLREGYNMLEFDFTNIPTLKLGDSHHCFRYPAPTKAGVRVFSANRMVDTVLDGVSGRMGDIWYSVAHDADLDSLAEHLAATECRVVGMTDVNGCFENTPLKRSFLVRGPRGRAFRAFDDLYLAQGREQRSQTFEAAGSHGGSLASELVRIQGDTDLAASARNAFAREVAGTYQIHNGFEDFVPKTNQAYIDPGTGIPQPNSWTMRGSSLPDDSQSNPGPWDVASTLSDPVRASSSSGLVHINTTSENTAYYATTPSQAPWDLNGARAVSMRFKLLEHDTTNGSDGALQLAVGDGSRIWTCQVAPAEIKVQGSSITLPAATFPIGLIDGRFHTLQINLSGSGNDAIVSIDGEVLTSTANAQNGALDGIAFGDPGPDISGKIEVESVGFENSELKYEYGIYNADDYADSDEITGLNNVMLYLRSKGVPFRTSHVGRWVKLIDPRVYEWLLETYTGTRWDGAEQELNIYTKKDIWLGSVVEMDEDEQTQGIIFRKTTKVSNTLSLDTEETKVFATDKPRAEIELAGILVSWSRQQFEYQQWLAGILDEDAGFVTQILIKQENTTKNIKKWSKRAEMTIELGGEIALSMSNEFADYAFTINEIRQGEYMAMIGFIPGVPGAMAKTIKVIRKSDGVTLDVLDKLSHKVSGFPGGMRPYRDAHLQDRILNLDAVFGDASDPSVVRRATDLVSSNPISAYVPGSRSGLEILSTFKNGAVNIYRTKEPIKLYRVYKYDGPNQLPISGFFSLEKPTTLSEAISDGGLINPLTNQPWQQYDRLLEIEVPADTYIYVGEAAAMGSSPGGGIQVWLSDETTNALPWVQAHASSQPFTN